MACGMVIFWKLFLTLFRIGAVIFGSWYLHRIINRKLKTRYIICIALILAGAIGNIIDSVFYGVIFNASTTSQIATFVPIGEGSSTWFYGRVLDMFYFPIIDTYWLIWLAFVCCV